MKIAVIEIVFVEYIIVRIAYDIAVDVSAYKIAIADSFIGGKL